MSMQASIPQGNGANSGTRAKDLPEQIFTPEMNPPGEWCGS